MILDQSAFKKYNERILDQAISVQKDISWCPTADCGYAFIFEEEDTELNCPKCYKHYCLNCRVTFHAGLSCAEYRVSTTHSSSDEQFLDFVKGKKYKQCPHCSFWVEKGHGCDHMRCRCGNHFCYQCGGIYGKCPCKRKI